MTARYQAATPKVGSVGEARLAGRENPARIQRAFQRLVQLALHRAIAIGDLIHEGVVGVFLTRNSADQSKPR